MISLDCHHPDLLDFIDIKTSPDAITKANISIRVTNDFMEAVINDKDWTMSFTRPETGETITKSAKAREIFEKLCKNNWDWGEPGILFGILSLIIIYLNMMIVLSMQVPIHARRSLFLREDLAFCQV